MKKYLGILLAAVITFALVGCTVTTTTKEAQTTTNQDATTADNDSTSATSKVDDNKVYTYRGAVNSLPTSWNVHTYQSNDANTVLGYTEDALYEFDYNETKDGYKIVPSMATSFPVDVTSEYVGAQWGIKAGETGKAYKIELKSGLKFENGDPITAQSFVNSVQLLLNPKAANYRADSMYSGNLKIVNAANYVKGGTYGLSEFVSENYGDDEYVDPKDFTTTEEGTLQYEGKDIILVISDGGNWGSNSLVDYAGAGYLLADENHPYVMDSETNRVKMFDAEGTWILTRTEEKNETTEDYDFYDLEGNAITRELGEDGKTYTYKNKDGEVVEAWAGCQAQLNNSPEWTALEAAADEDDRVYLTPALLANLQNCIAMLHGYATAEEYATDPEDPAGDYAYQEFEEMAYFGKTYEEIPFEQVGFKADGNNIIIILEKELTGFYLNYALCTSFFLVHEATYNACAKTTDNVYTNDYGTSAAKYVGFGPYKITSYVGDSEIRFEKNSNWWGYSDPTMSQYYQTTNISFKQVSSEATRLEMFLKGELDSYGLQKDDMEDYQSSRWTYFTEGDSTWFVAINPSMSGLTETQKTASPVTAGNRVYKTVLTLKDFRMALSFSIDRQAYALALDPLGGVAKALYGNMIISDPESGTAYRTTEAAKDTILAFWGLADEVGEDKEYETKEDAIDSITGYDLAGAKELFRSAYATAVEDQLIDVSDANWEVQIMIGQPGSGSSKYYNDGYVYLSKVWTDAVKGTPFEGHLTFKQSGPLGSTNFSKFLKDNSVDILFGVGWTGSALDPYGLMEAYVSPTYQYDPAWDTSKTYIDVDVTIEGVAKTLRASVYAWGKEALNGTDILATVVVDGEETDDEVEIECGTSQDPAIRLAVLAAVEKAVLEQYDMIPVNLDSSANLKGMRINYGTEEYVFGVGRGGLRYMTYVMDDEAWSAYVAQQGGTLNYK